MAIMSFVVGKGHNPPVLIVDEKDNVIFPTMFTLWNMRSIVPTLFIRPETWQFLARGADLMLPGVLRPEALGLPPYAPFVIGSVWSVSIVPPQESGIAPIPVAVGDLLLGEQEVRVLGWRGRALRVVHLFKDAVWEMGRISPPSLDLILAGRLPKRPSSSPNSTPAAGDGSGLQETGEAEPSSEDPQDISPDKAQAAEAGGAELDGSKKEEECAGTGAPTGGEADGAPTQEPAPASSSLLPQPISERTDGAGSLPGGTGKDAVKSATARATVDRSAAVLGGHGNQGAGCAVGSDSHLADEESEGAEGTGETAVPAAISMGANVEGSKMGGGASATVQREVLIERCFVQALETLTPDKLPCEVSAFHSQYLLPILRAAGVDFAGTRWKKPATFFSAMLRRGLWHLSGLPSSSKRGGSSWRVATVVRTHPDYLAQLGDGEGNSSSRARHAAAVEEKGKKPEESSKEEMDAPRDSIEKSSDGNEEEASDSGGEEGEEQDRESDDEDDKGDEDEDRSESRGSEVASSRKAGNGAPSGSVATAADPKKKPSPPTIRVVELFRPTAVTTPLFATALADPALAAQVVAVGARGAPLPPGVELPADVYTKEQVLTLLKRYCEARSLDAVAHGQPVPLDDALVAALYRSTKKALIPAASPLRALAERLLGCLQPFYFLIPPKQQSDAAKEPAGDGVPAPSGEATGAIPGAAAAPAVVSARLFQGRLAPVSIEVVRRQARKSTTVVRGLEGFAIDADAFAVEIQRNFGCSASVHAAASTTGAHHTAGQLPREVEASGHLLREVARYLVEKRGIPKRFIITEDKTGHSKKRAELRPRGGG